MIKLFRGNMLVQAVLIIALLILLWTPALLAPAAIATTGSDGLLYGYVASWLAHTPLLAVIVAMLLTLAEGVLLNLLLASVGIVPQTTLMPTLLFVIAISATTTTLSPILLTTAIFLLCLQQLTLNGSLLTIDTNRICTTTALISICTLIYIPSVAFLLTYLLVVINYRLYSWRDWMALLLGLLAPYLLTALILYLCDGLTGWWQSIIDTVSTINLNTIESETTVSSIANIILGAIIAVSLVAMWSKLSENTVIWQKNVMTVIFFAVGGIGVLVVTELFPIDISLFAIPFALCGSHLLIPEKKMLTMGRKKQHLWIRDVLLVVIIISAYLC